MFFYLSKIFWAVISPLGLIWVLMLAGLALLPWDKRLGTSVLAAGATLFVFLGFFPVGQNLTALLERQYPRPELPANVDGILVLGGAFDTYISAARGESAINGSIDRLVAFMDLARRYPRAELVFSGGAGHVLNSQHREADEAAAFFDSVGFPSARVIFERDSRNTFENVTATKELVKPGEGDIWVVITSGYHMPRAMGVFAKAGWDVIPYPVDPVTDGKYRLLPAWLAVAGNFGMLELAVKEFAGSAAYYMTGKSAFFFPLRRVSFEHTPAGQGT